VRSVAYRGPLGALVAIGLVLVLAFTIDPKTRPANVLTDFSAFYCAGSAHNQGADPYLMEPLATCERAPVAGWMSRSQPGLAIPAPLPPYVLAGFSALARLPYVAAGFAWWTILLAALALTAVALRRATGLRWTAVIGAIALGDGYVGLALGQIAPLAIAAVATAMWLLETKRDAAAGWVAALAMVEPHLGLPACLALFLWRPQTRFPLAAAGALLALGSVATYGLPLWREYLGGVLPAHAAAEVENVKQLSFAYVAHRLGAGDALALRLGELSYLAMAALGVALAPQLARRAAAPGLLVALPAAFAVVGGPFVHIAQIGVALPAALLLYARSEAARPVLRWAIAGLALPFVQLGSLGYLSPLLECVACGAVLLALGTPLRAAAAGAVGSLALPLVAWSLLVTKIQPPGAALLAAYDPHALAENSWALYVRIVGTSDPLAYDLAKLPTWLALGALVWTALALARDPSPAKLKAARNGNAPAGRIAL
jgi:hypothetical protein